MVSPLAELGFVVTQHLLLRHTLHHKCGVNTIWLATALDV